MSITVLCPSRGNPAAAAAARESFEATKMLDDSSFVAVVDQTDPKLGEYDGLRFMVVEHKGGNMNLALNEAAAYFGAKDPTGILGFVGDDHRFRTQGWDRVISQILGSGGGLLYADDLAQREQLPTQVFISAPIVKALGWFGLRGANHLYLDNAWKVLGEAADCLYYVPDLVIEHMHPAYGKGEWDEGHIRVNSQENYDHDRLVYEAWLADGFEEDAGRVRSALDRA